MIFENHETSPPANDTQVVIFMLDGQRYAVPMDAVERVIRAVAVTPVPETPEFVLGLINQAGRVMPVFSFRRCLGIPDRSLRPEDQFVIMSTGRLILALMVDEIQGLSSININQTAGVEETLPDGGCRAEGLAKIGGDIILIYDVDKFFSLEDRDRILRAQAAAQI